MDERKYAYKALITFAVSLPTPELRSGRSYSTLGVGDAPETAVATEPAPTRQRSGTKQEALIAMLRADGGATIDEIVAALQWQAHTVRGVMSGALKNKLGLTITSEKVDGRGRCYRIAA